MTSNFFSASLFRPLLLILCALLAPQLCAGQTVANILETLQQKQIERIQGVNAYSVVKQFAGQSITEYYQRVDVEGEDGKRYPVFQRVSGETLRCASGAQPPTMTAAGYESYARGLEMTGDAVATNLEEGLEAAGLPRDLFTTMGAGGDPWATTDLRRMTSTMAVFARAGAQASERQPVSTAATEDSASELLVFARTAKLLGSEKIDGRAAYHLRAEDMNRVQQVDGQTFTINAMSLWIDTKEYVPLQSKVDGVISQGKETRPFVIEKLDTDYRHVPGSKLYESFKQVMRINGMMDAKQQAEMAEAQKKMADFEKQMAAMPDSQRQMMQQMMGPQLDSMRKMAAGGAFESEMTITAITVLPTTTTADCAL